MTLVAFLSRYISGKDRKNGGRCSVVFFYDSPSSRFTASCLGDMTDTAVDVGDVAEGNAYRLTVKE